MLSGDPVTRSPLLSQNILISSDLVVVFLLCHVLLKRSSCQRYYVAKTKGVFNSDLYISRHYCHASKTSRPYILTQQCFAFSQPQCSFKCLVLALVSCWPHDLYFEWNSSRFVRTSVFLVDLWRSDDGSVTINGEKSIPRTVSKSDLVGLSSQRVTTPSGVRHRVVDKKRKSFDSRSKPGLKKAGTRKSGNCLKARMRLL